jgi:DNA repair protein RecO
MNYALTIIDIVQHIHYVESPSKIIFRLLNKVLNHLNDCEKNKALLLYIFFQLQCLIYLGYRPAIEKCYQCNKKLESAALNYGTGQLACTQCVENDKTGSNTRFEI